MPRIPRVGGPVARHAFVGLLEVEQAMVVLIVRRLRVVDVPDQQAAPREGGVESERLSMLDEEIFRGRAGQAQAEYLPGCLDRIDRGADLRGRHVGGRDPSEPEEGPGAHVGGARTRGRAVPGTQRQDVPEAGPGGRAMWVVEVPRSA